MSLLSHVKKNVSQLPFFCSSNSLVFYLDDSSTLSQVLTLYNPYEFSVRYKVLCTAPRTYSIIESQGQIHSKHSVDAIVRLIDKSSNHNTIHRIRIQYFDHRKPKDLIGKCDITCTILSYKPAEHTVDDDVNKLSNRIRRTTTPQPTSVQPQKQDPILVVVLVVLGAICACILLLPTVSDTETKFRIQLPSYLHMTINSKVIASYILGLLTVVFIRR